jgi:stearoyl-CoA desaturase (delta-9 desaturase)
VFIRSLSAIRFGVTASIGVSLHQSTIGEPQLTLNNSVENQVLSALDIVSAADSDHAIHARRHEAPLDHASEQPAPNTSLFVRLATFAAVVLPPIALVAVMFLAWGGWFHWVDVALMVGMYVITGLGVTIGYHRLYTHKSFATRGPVAAFFGICGSMAVQGPIIWWCATHRKHHQHSDDEHDPHSPHAGREPGAIGWIKSFSHSHIGWLFSDLAPDMKRYVPDLLADKTTVRISKLFPLWVVLGVAIPTVIGGLVTMSWMGALLGFLWGGIVRICLLHHVTWSVNSVCHIWGAKEYNSGDESRNNPIMGILALGEGWHNNHHAFPASARHGLKWWQFDASWVVIRTLEKLGLAKKVRLPAPERLATRRV